MDSFQKIVEITGSEVVGLGVRFKETLHKKLCLGQTRYVCRYGTLSDGHEKITDAQRYFQAIKEMYYLASNMRDQKALAMEAQADLMEAQDKLLDAHTEPEMLRAGAAKLRAETRLTTALVTVEDQMRMLDEYNNVRLELEPIVEARYPGGIEQAEPDNWKAVAEYRMIKERVPGLAKERLDNVPMDPLTKAKLGQHYGRMDAIAPLLVANNELAQMIPDARESSLIDFISSVEQLQTGGTN